ncbi:MULTISPECIES: hypothetical protein [unclassified Crossiella]|uniref:hypothetical protein n=1 Tax=unclassified Crossiella TaxID=2620835 RepID=UPI001FFFE7D9|nr:MULTISPECIES: hypothetical protein [unclassified Crossiella]MCK2241941.1 hypothetical protein [Crossiella sp. S99.2]MCK2255844.1 hypothetical protein [Crossiella sp. S99.1]
MTYQDLGIRPVINADSTLTRLGGSVLAPPVAAAMVAAGREFVDLAELHRAVGDRLAELTGNEAGYVTCGAWAGTVHAVAACLAGADPELAARLPDTRGLPRDEVVVFAAQRKGYEEAARLTGAKLTTEIGPRTAAVLWYAGPRFAEGAPELAEVVATGVPVIVDAAAQIPPISTLWRHTVELGAAAVVVSGGKGLRGPQSSGLVLGRRSLIEGCRVHGSPNHGVGRGMKVGKEELLGLLAAVEWNLAQDETAVLAGYEAAVDRWLTGLAAVPGVRLERGYPSEAGQPHSRAIVHIGPDRDRVVAALLAGEPRVAVGVLGADAIALNPQTVAAEEVDLVLTAVLQTLRTR